MAEAYPSERTVELAGGSVRPAPRRVVPALGGVCLSPTFTHPAPSAIRHPAEGMAVGLWVEETGFMGRARQQGCEGAAGEMQERRIWQAAGNRWGSASGAPMAKRVLHPAVMPLLPLP